MRKKYFSVLLGILMAGVIALGGCAATPESSLVKQKGKSAMKNYKSADDTTESTSENTTDESVSLTEASETSDGSQAPVENSGTSDGSQTESTDGEKDTVTAALPAEEGSTAGVGNAGLRKRLGAPETYQSEVKDATGNLTITTDAKVLLPDAEKLNTITVTQHSFDQTVIDNITETFFAGGTIYDGIKYNAETKSEIQAKLDKLNGYVAAGNLDPYGYEKKGYSYDIYSEIEYLEEDLEAAPEERTLEEVKPQFGLQKDMAEEIVGKNGENYFWGIVEMPDGSRFSYELDKYSSMPMKVKIHRLEEDEGTYSDGIWGHWRSTKASYSDAPDEQELKDEIGISLEEAKQTADQILEPLGLTDLALAGWEYELKFKDNQTNPDAATYTRENQEAAGYLLHYTHRVDGVPVTYLNTFGGTSEAMDLETETWSYEHFDIIVSARGIEDVVFTNQYDIGEVQTKNVVLMPFSDMIQAYEKIMLAQNADLLSYNNSYSYYINRIELGYVRIYSPSSDTQTGLLVPAWTFFGYPSWSKDSDGQEISKNLSMASPFYNELCINAVDGSIINTEYGY